MGLAMNSEILQWFCIILLELDVLIIDWMLFSIIKNKE